MRVLVVDDEIINLKILSKLLKELNFEVHVASDGKEAWDFLQAPPPDIDILLTDKMMPNMSGIELTKKLKASDTLKHVPIIMLSAADSAEDIKEGEEAGVYRYIPKPFTKEMLLSIVGNAIESKKSSDSGSSNQG